MKASWKSGKVPSQGATIQLRKSTSPPHSEEFVIMPSVPLFDVLFVSTMALKALGSPHLLAAFSPNLESLVSSP